MIKYLIVDIDGGLSDGYINLCSDGISKKYNIKDISALMKLSKMGVNVVTINDVNYNCDKQLRHTVWRMLDGENKLQTIIDFLKQKKSLVVLL